MFSAYANIEKIMVLSRGFNIVLIGKISVLKKIHKISVPKKNLSMLNFLVTNRIMEESLKVELNSY